VLSHGEQSLTVGSNAHGTEFVQSEGFAVFADAFLNVETATFAASFDFQTDGCKDG
jgi:hypothetical protein